MSDDTWVEALERDLAECYRLSGADSDGDEDWRLATYAVAEVRRMREEHDADAARVAALEEALREARDHMARLRSSPVRVALLARIDALLAGVTRG